MCLVVGLNDKGVVTVHEGIKFRLGDSFAGNAK